MAFEQSPAAERYIYERSPATVLRREDFSLQDAARKVIGYEIWEWIDGREFLVPMYSDAQAVLVRSGAMSLRRSLTKGVEMLQGVIPGFLVFLKLCVLVTWHCLRYPRSESLIDYEKGTVYLRKD